MTALYKLRKTFASDKLRDQSEGYRVATEALTIAADSGCTGETYERLTDLVLREAGKVAA